MQSVQLLLYMKNSSLVISIIKHEVWIGMTANLHKITSWADSNVLPHSNAGAGPSPSLAMVI